MGRIRMPIICEFWQDTSYLFGEIFSRYPSFSRLYFTKVDDCVPIVAKYSAEEKEKWVLLMDNFTNFDVDKLREHETLRRIIPCSRSVKCRWPQKMNLSIWDDAPPSATNLGVELPCQQLSELIYANFRENALTSETDRPKIRHRPHPSQQIHTNVVATRSGNNVTRHEQQAEMENDRETVVFSYCVDFGRAAGVTMGCLQLNDSLHSVVNQSSSNSCVISIFTLGRKIL